MPARPVGFVVDARRAGAPPAGACRAWFWGRLDNRGAVVAALGPDAPAAGVRAADGDLVLACWRRWGEAFPERLLGDYALALRDPERDLTFLARDPLGVRPLFFVHDARGMVATTAIATLLETPGLSLTPDPQWIARHLVGLASSDGRAAYREVHKVPPGHSLTFEGSAPPRARRHHRWRDDAPPARQREARWVEDYRACLEEAVRCRMGGDGPIGSENSGGLDSATITAYLARLLGDARDRLHCFGFAFAEHEPAFILETSRALGLRHNYISCSVEADADRIEAGIDRALDALGHPVEHAVAAAHRPFYEECRQRGITTLFSGFGGDEVVTNPGLVVRRELVDDGDLRNLWSVLPGDPLSRTGRFVKALTLGRRPQDLHPAFLAAWQAQRPQQLLRQEVVESLDLERETMESLRFDAPYRRLNDFILQGLLPRPYIAARFENCTLLAASHGIEYRWPLWDVRLVQQYLSTPSIEKLGPRGVGRYLHRRAIDGIVPARVAWKPGKDMGDIGGERTGEASGRAVAELARRQLDALHPTLADLVDAGKLREQAARAEKGEAGPMALAPMRRGAIAVAGLNRWLWRQPARS